MKYTVLDIVQHVSLLQKNSAVFHIHK